MGCEKLKRNEGNDAVVKRLGPVSRCIHISLGYGTLRAQITLPTSFRELANACSPERVFTYSFKGYFDPRLPPPESSIFLPKNGISRFGEGMVEGMVSSFPLPSPINFKVARNCRNRSFHTFLLLDRCGFFERNSVQRLTIPSSKANSFLAFEYSNIRRNVEASQPRVYQVEN